MLFVDITNYKNLQGLVTRQALQVVLLVGFYFNAAAQPSCQANTLLEYYSITRRTIKGHEERAMLRELKRKRRPTELTAGGQITP